MLVALTAFAPALRAGRLRTVEAIAVGRSPKIGRGRVARRVLSRVPLPRAVSLGLGGPFARPARTLAVAASVVFGATALTFALGLVSSFNDVHAGQNRNGTADVAVDIGATSDGGDVVHAGPKGVSQSAADPQAVAAAIAAQPGTRSYYGTGGTVLAVSGLSGTTQVRTLQGAAAVDSVPLISGSWFTGPGQAVVPTRFLQNTGTSIGSTITLTDDGVLIPVRIVGEVFDLRSQNGELTTDARTLSAVDHVDRISGFEIHLNPGVDRATYIKALNAKLHPMYADAQDAAADSGGSTLPFFEGMIAILTAMLATVAGLAVLNAAVLETRERVHDLGVYKAIGMSPETDHCDGAQLGHARRPVRRNHRRADRNRAAQLRRAGHGAHRRNQPPARVHRGVPRHGDGPARPWWAGHRDRGCAAPGELGGQDPYRDRAAHRVGDQAGARAALRGGAVRAPPARDTKAVPQASSAHNV